LAAETLVVCSTPYRMVICRRIGTALGDMLALWRTSRSRIISSVYQCASPFEPSMVRPGERAEGASGKPREIRQTPDQGPYQMRPADLLAPCTGHLIGFIQCERGLAPGTLQDHCRYYWCAAPDRTSLRGRPCIPPIWMGTLALIAPSV
jgi:hypothetical protein